MYKTLAQETMKKTIDWNFQKEMLFPVVRASKLSLKDSFLRHIPETDKQLEAKKMIMCAINIGGLQDFRKPIMDPSVDEDGNIFFEKGNKPALGLDVDCWEDKAKKFMPSKNSRIGTKKEYGAFMGVIIKTLMEEEGFKIEDAWRAVCDNSRHLGHYQDSYFANLGPEPTGNRPVGKWCDLANNPKIIKTGAFLYALASGGCEVKGDASPLANVQSMKYTHTSCENAVGWIIMDV